uniref:DB domain-containing protein n=1 Tax=Parastrongyloides trichosuri TaxID=131310 RepID=A0A0N4Z0D8_PARTI
MKILSIILLLFIINDITYSKKYCGSSLTQFISKTCGFAGESKPCLKDDGERILKDRCCHKGCSIVEAKAQCCWTKACLDRCYPGKRYNNGEAIEEKLCNEKLNKYLVKACAFGKETKPCFINNNIIVEDMKESCCEKGCNMNTIYRYCCFDNECLERCYPGKGYKNGEIYK